MFLVIYNLIFCDSNKEVSATSTQIFVKSDKFEPKILYKLIVQVSNSCLSHCADKDIRGVALIIHQSIYCC